MKPTEHKIVVKASIRLVYEAWRHLENLPFFVSGVQSIRQLNDECYLWQSPSTSAACTVCRLNQHVPYRFLAWTGGTGPYGDASVQFEALGLDSTGLRLRCSSEPGQARDDLRRFRRFIEDGSPHPARSYPWAKTA